MNQQLGWGLIGASNIARTRMIGAINAQPDSRVVAVMSRDKTRAQNFADEFELPAAYDSIDAILSDPRVNIVYISTTNELHHAQTLAAAHAGKHILCEKPLALALTQACEMVAACQRANVVLGTNHHMRSTSIHRAVRKMIDEGAIGTVLSARLYRAKYLPENLQTWRLDKSDGGGVILDMTVHDADTTRFWLNREVEAVMAMTAQQGLGVGDIEDMVMGTLRFQNDVLVQFHDSFVDKHATMGFEIFGTAGALIGENDSSGPPSDKLFLRRHDQREQIPLVFENPYERTVRLFNAAVRGEGQLAATGDDGLRSLQIALAVRESALTGKQVYLK